MRGKARRLILKTFAWSDGHADFTGIFNDPRTLASLGPGLVESHRDNNGTAVVAAEARGFILGSLCAVALGVGFVPARKPGSVHPGEKIHANSEPGWQARRHTFRIAKVFGPADRVLLVDDWIETGSQAAAITEAVTSMGANAVGVSVIVDQAPPQIRSSLNVTGLVDYTDLPGDH